MNTLRLAIEISQGIFLHCRYMDYTDEGETVVERFLYLSKLKQKRTKVRQRKTHAGRRSYERDYQEMREFCSVYRCQRMKASPSTSWLLHISLQKEVVCCGPLEFRSCVNIFGGGGWQETVLFREAFSRADTGLNLKLYKTCMDSAQHQRLQCAEDFVISASWLSNEASLACPLKCPLGHKQIYMHQNKKKKLRGDGNKQWTWNTADSIAEIVKSRRWCIHHFVSAKQMCTPNN